MTIQQLKSFLAVCEEMNYTRAAQKCYISRQALRQNISALEDELCGLLFVNNSNHLTLTATGLKLYNEAQPVVESFDRLEESMLADINKTTELSLGISYALVPDYLPNLFQQLERFQHYHRNINLKLFKLNNDDIAPLVASGKLDCGLVMDLGSGANDVQRTVLSSHKAAIIFPCSDPLSKSTSIDLSQLSGKKLCLPGLGREMQPLCAMPEIETYLAPSYYQAYYLIRENGYCAITRTEESGVSSFDFVNVVPVSGLTIHSSLIKTRGSESAEIKQLAAYLKSETSKDFA